MFLSILEKLGLYRDIEVRFRDRITQYRRFPIYGNVLHCEDGPAIIRGIGTYEWYKHGKRHRTDGPACVIENRDSEWWLNGQLHRTGNGPTCVYTSGDVRSHRRMWYKHGKVHRENGPAIEWFSGNEEWYQDGVRHREGGPAVVDPDGFRSFWRKGVLLGSGFSPPFQNSNLNTTESFRSSKLNWAKEGF